MQKIDFKKLFMPKQDTPQAERIYYIDFLKILAAFLTVFYHFAYYKLNYGFDNTKSIYFPNINRIIMCFAACCVPLFFMVNGYLLFGKKHSWQNVYQKAFKILILIIVWHFVDFPSWFFQTLFILYIAFPLFQYLYEKCIKLYYLIILFLLVFPFGYNATVLIIKLLCVNKNLYILGNNVDISQLSATGLFTMYSIVYFLLGPVISKLNLRTSCGIMAMVFGLGMVVFECVSYTTINKTMYDGVNAAFPTYGALLLSIGVFVTAKNTVKRSHQIIPAFKNGILTIYLLHMLIIRIIGKIFEFTSLSLPTAIIGTVIILLICTGIGKIANRIPVVCCFFRI